VSEIRGERGRWGSEGSEGDADAKFRLVEADAEYRLPMPSGRIKDISADYKRNVFLSPEPEIIHQPLGGA
jgi:hypothetical protein